MHVSEDQRSHKLYVRSWLFAFCFFMIIFVVSLLATIQYATFPDITWTILDGNITARLILAFSGTILAVLCLWGVEYARERKQAKKEG